MMYEGNHGLRQIFTDGRPLPKLDDDLQPWWYGYSVGHWEGDTLVVETDRASATTAGSTCNGSPLTDEGQADRAVPPTRLRPARDRHHDRRPEGVHEAVHRSREPSDLARSGTDRVRLQREREVFLALRHNELIARLVAKPTKGAKILRTEFEEQLQ